MNSTEEQPPKATGSMIDMLFDAKRMSLEKHLDEDIPLQMFFIDRDPSSPEYGQTIYFEVTRENVVEFIKHYNPDYLDKMTRKKKTEKLLSIEEMDKYASEIKKATHT
jgi:hypothetical protein